MFSRMAGYQAFLTGIKATAIFLLGEKQAVSNGIKQDGSMAWMQHRPQMRIRPLFADTGILRMAIDACTAFSGKVNCLVIEA